MLACLTALHTPRAGLKVMRGLPAAIPLCAPLRPCNLTSVPLQRAHRQAPSPLICGTIVLKSEKKKKIQGGFKKKGGEGPTHPFPTGLPVSFLALTGSIQSPRQPRAPRRKCICEPKQFFLQGEGLTFGLTPVSTS